MQAHSAGMHLDRMAIADALTEVMGSQIDNIYYKSETTLPLSLIHILPAEIQSSHAWTDGTQTNWNGILGDFYIEATPHTYLKQVQVYPSVKEKKARIHVNIYSDSEQSGIVTPVSYTHLFRGSILKKH